MKALLCALRDSLISLKLTLVLLGLGMILVFVATLDQVDLGVWAVQEKYFRAFAVYLPVGPIAVPVFPAGYLVGGLLLVNLIASFFFRFRFSWRRSGILLAHAGIIVLLIGELLTGLWQRDYFLRLDEGQTRNYAESFRAHELAIVDTTETTSDTVVAVPAELLTRRREIPTPTLPFRVVPRGYYHNSLLQMRPPASTAPTMATTGAGQHLLATPQPMTYKSDERNLPTAFVELVGPEGSLGVWLVSTHLLAEQTFTHAGRTYALSLRPTRSYKPFSLTLLKFNHDRYAGTQIPKNFSSRLRLQTADGQEDREVLIYMNNPLRHSGYTFYQSGFDNNDRTTILQVVHNPSWIFPYVATVLMSLGLAVQFGLHLITFARRRRVAPPPPAVVQPMPARTPRPSPVTV